MLSVLLREMVEIRASQSVMLAREEMFEKKRKPSATVSSSEGLLKSLRQRGMLRKSLRKVPSQPLRRGVSRKKSSLMSSLVLL